MNRGETIAAVTRKLRGLRQRDVRDVLDVLIEVWTETLKQPGGYIRIDGFGKLYVERQRMRSGGMIRQHLMARDGEAPETVERLYFRFSPSQALKTAVASEGESEEETE